MSGRPDGDALRARPGASNRVEQIRGEMAAEDPRIDLDDTSNCPLDSVCGSCRRHADLVVTTIKTSIGIFCVTMCGGCIRGNNLPGLSVVSAVRATLEHCGHLNISADQMASAMEDEK